MVRYRGEFYQVDGGFTVPGTTTVAVVVPGTVAEDGAGRRRAFLWRGYWLAGPRTLEADIVPELIKVPMMPVVRGLGS